MRPVFLMCNPTVSRKVPSPPMMAAYLSARLTDERSRLATTSTLASSGFGAGSASGLTGMRIGLFMPPSGLPGATTVQADDTATAANPMITAVLITPPSFLCRSRSKC